MQLRKMNLNEAYKIFELTPKATDEEIKAKYKQLTKQYHPDINKEPGADDKFKQINAANDLLKTRNNFSNFRKVNNQPEEIVFTKTITFAEAVKGTKVELSYDRFIQCNKCSGNGWVRDNGGKACAKCGNTGFVTTRNGNMITQSTCVDCHHKQKTTCDSCYGESCILSKTSISVKIPPGIDTNSVMRLHSMGNYTKNNIIGFFQINSGGSYEDAFLKIEYPLHPTIDMHEGDLYSTIDISLLEAISGCKKEIPYIEGTLPLEIPKKSNNGSQVVIKNKGAGGVNDFLVNINVLYPSEDKLEKIVKILQDE